MKCIFPAAPEEALLKTLHPDRVHSLPQYRPMNHNKYKQNQEHSLMVQDSQ